MAKKRTRVGRPKVPARDRMVPCSVSIPAHVARTLAAIMKANGATRTEVAGPILEAGIKRRANREGLDK